MKTVLLYRPNSEHERQALDYMRDFTAQTGKHLQTMDPDSPSGTDLCKMYDILQFPAILVTDDDGAMQNLWTAGNLPTFSEVSYYIDEGSMAGGNRTLETPTKPPVSL
jgi:hypothetical protein